ncbi:MAG TPA: alpha/beta hydrolase-fold protein [Thermoanaerobaculia bacterium]|nr:alpha/beta hydrolase-fold protein [Thermoanaerobaculia bacterium]
MRDTLRGAFERVLRLPNRRKEARRGTLDHIRGFHSEILGNDRDITIYLPPGYDERGDLRFPVLYMQDGQNLFEPERAFIPGQHWRLAEAADEKINHRTARAMIIVGVDNTPSRIDEYTPTNDAARHGGGKADDYGRMLIEELKPIIDAHYRTLPDAPNTALGGSSLGGLTTLYLGLTRPDVYGHLAVMSPSVWWDNRSILAEVDRYDYDAPRRPRIWLDMGGREGVEGLADARQLRDRLRMRGWRREDDLHYFEDRRADHSERAWARRVPAVLEFLFPALELSPLNGS